MRRSDKKRFFPAFGVALGLLPWAVISAGPAAEPTPAKRSAKAAVPFLPGALGPDSAKLRGILAGAGLRKEEPLKTASKTWMGSPVARDEGDGGEGRGGGGNPCADCVAGSVECGGTIEGDLQPGDCTLATDGSYFDVWRFELAAPQEATIRLTSADFDAFLFLVDAACDAVATNDDCAPGGLDSCLSRTLAAGTYFLVANSFAAGETGRYRLDVSCAPPTAVCRDCAVGTVACGETKTGSLSPADCPRANGFFSDLYRLELSEPTRVLLRLSSLQFDTFLRLRDTDCVPVAENDDCPDTSRSCIIADLEAGTHFVEVTSFATGETGDYGLAVQCWPGLNLCTDCLAGTVTCGEPLSAAFPATSPADGCLASGGQSVDLYAFELPAAGPVSLRLSSETFDTVLFLYDAECRLIAANDDCRGGTLNSCLDIPGLAAGAYHAGVSSFDSGAFGGFSLEVLCPDVRLCRDCGGGSLACGGVAGGTLEAGDCEIEPGRFLDSWELELTEPSNVTLSVSSEAADTVLELRNPFCEVLETKAGCDGGAADSCQTLKGLLPGTYSVSVSSSAAGEGGPYELEVECEPFDPCRDCLTGEIACGGAAIGALEPGDCVLGDGTFFDVRSFTLDRAQRVAIELTSADFDAYLLLIAGDCSLVAEADDCDAATTNSCLVADLPAGPYFVVANSFAPAAGMYSLRVSCADIPYCRDCAVGSIACTGTITGSLPASGCRLEDGSSIDVYEFLLPGESQVDVSLRSTAFDPFLFLADESCFPVAFNDDCAKGGFDSCLSVGLPAGRYFLWVNSFSAGESGPYTLAVSAPDCNFCPVCNVGSLHCGESRGGTLPGSGCELPGGLPADFWELTIDEEREIDIRLESAVFDPSLALLDQACQVLAENDDCDANTLDSCLSIELSPGSYYLRASALFPEDQGDYELHIGCGGGQLPGDCNQDGRLDISDGVCLLGFLFTGSPAALPCGNRSSNDPANILLLDINGSGAIDISDAVSSFTFLFTGGPPPVLGEECIGITGCDDACTASP